MSSLKIDLEAYPPSFLQVQAEGPDGFVGYNGCARGAGHRTKNLPDHFDAAPQPGTVERSDRAVDGQRHSGEEALDIRWVKEVDLGTIEARARSERGQRKGFRNDLRVDALNGFS